MNDDGFVRETRATGPSVLSLFAHGDDETDHVIGRDIDQFAHGIGVEADHGAGVVAHVMRGQHKSHAGEAGGTNTLIANETFFTLVERGGHGSEDVLDGLGGVTPDLFWVDVVRVEVGAHDEHHAGI